MHETRFSKKNLLFKNISSFSTSVGTRPLAAERFFNVIIDLLARLVDSDWFLFCNFCRDTPVHAD